MFPKANITERVIPSRCTVGGGRLRGLGTEQDWEIWHGGVSGVRGVVGSEDRQSSHKCSRVDNVGGPVPTGAYQK